MEGGESMKKKRRPFKAFIRRYGRVLIGAVIIAVMVITAVFAPLIATHDPYHTDIKEAKKAPSSEHLFGTDIYGRDNFSRIVYGSRITLVIGIGVQVLVVAIGTTLGLLSGYYRKFDNICSRVMEGLAAMPQLLLALAVATLLGEGTFNVIFSLVVCALPSITRAVRSQVLSLRELEFVESAKAKGASDARIIFLHILPHCSSYLLIRCATGISGTITNMCTLSFLGVGLDPTIPSWGATMADGNALLLFYPYMCVIPGLVICVTVFGFTIMGEGLRDVLDPKLR